MLARHLSSWTELAERTFAFGPRLFIVASLLVVSCSPLGLSQASAEPSPTVFGIYSFPLESGVHLDPVEQVTLASGVGYNAMVIPKNPQFSIPEFAARLRSFMAVPQVRAHEFDISAAFMGVDLSEPLDREEIGILLDTLRDAQAALWIACVGHARPPEIRSKMRDLADLANEYGVTIVLYPHYDTLLPTAEEGVKWINVIGRPNVKLVLHLSHELKAGNGSRLGDVIGITHPYLAAVTINGADREVTGEGIEGDRYDYWRSIKVLGEGDLDVCGKFLMPIIGSGYSGPFFLFDDFNTILPAAERLDRSMTVWKLWTASACQP